MSGHDRDNAIEAAIEQQAPLPNRVSSILEAAWA